MVKKPIRNLHSTKSVPPRICDVVVEEDQVLLEFKNKDNSREKVPWNDIVYQVEQAKAANYS